MFIQPTTKNHTIKFDAITSYAYTDLTELFTTMVNKALAKLKWTRKTQLEMKARLYSFFITLISHIMHENENLSTITSNYN